MDQRLFQAAWNGDVDRLLKEVEAYPAALHAVALDGGQNPLHVACLAGHLNFAATLVNLRPQLAQELNQDGFSPLHIAASCGHVEIVKVLLQVNTDLCLFEGKDRKIPLHLGVIKGHVEVVRELLLSCSDSVECMTAQGETALHLAVKNNQFKAFEALVQHLKQVNKEELLNSKDCHGNTILHLAVYKKQYQVVDLILNGGGVISKEKVELNSLNKSGLTPLDMLLMCQSEAGDLEIHQMLVQTGALKAENLQSPAHTQEERPNVAGTRHQNLRSRAGKSLEYFRYDDLMKSTVEVKNTLLVIVILVTAATYQPVLNPPGGIWQEDYVPAKVNTSSSSPAGNATATIKPHAAGNNSLSSATSNIKATEPHTAGEPIMLSHESFCYNVFIFVNSIAFYMSIHMIHLLTISFPLRIELSILVLALMLSYSFGMLGIIPIKSGTSILFVSCYILQVLMPIILIFSVSIYSKRRRTASANTSQETV